MGAQKLCTEADFGRLYSEFYPDKLRVGLQDAFVRAIIILAGGNRGKDDEPVRSRPATKTKQGRYGGGMPPY